MPDLIPEEMNATVLKKHGGTEQLSSATKKLHGMVRETIPYLDQDVPLTDHIEAVASLFESGSYLDALPEDLGAYDW